MDQNELLKQLALAKTAGTKAHAKAFFAKVSGSDVEPPGNAHSPSGPDDGGGAVGADDIQPKPGAMGGIATDSDASNVDPEALQALLAHLGASPDDKETP